MRRRIYAEGWLLLHILLLRIVQLSDRAGVSHYSTGVTFPRLRLLRNQSVHIYIGILRLRVALAGNRNLDDMVARAEAVEYL